MKSPIEGQRGPDVSPSEPGIVHPSHRSGAWSRCPTIPTTDKSIPSERRFYRAPGQNGLLETSLSNPIGSDLTDGLTEPSPALHSTRPSGLEDIEKAASAFESSLSQIVRWSR